MPATEVYFYRDGDDVPVRDWLRNAVLRRNRPAFRKCLDRIELLRTFGHELRRPAADLLRDGIYELRIKVGRVNYRLLYFFHGRNIAIVAHGLTKEGRVPPVEIERALERKRLYEADPEAHQHDPLNEELEDDRDEDED